jgi:hypothetical protein
VAPAAAAAHDVQLAFDSEGIALTSTMGFVKNPVSAPQCSRAAAAAADDPAAAAVGATSQPWQCHRLTAVY